jgi:23S rRNA pseudouridine1911/1915/1917 synthase
VTRAFSHVAGPRDVGVRLDNFLARLHPELSRTRVQALIDDEHVRVDGKPARASQRMRAGERASLEVPPPRPAVPQPEDIPIQVIHEDADMVVLDKPAGIAVHPGAGAPSGTLVNALLHHVKDLAGVGGELRPGIVHRLDKETSGVLVVAKNDFAMQRLSAAFKARRVKKTYLAIVHGHPAAEGSFDTLYGRHPTQRTKFTTRVRAAAGVRRAALRWKVSKNLLTCALVEVDLLTGRTHQIRVQFAEAGHPLLADAVYGGAKREDRLAAGDPVRQAAALVGRQALHAWKLELEHPRTGETVRFSAPAPPEFQAALERLERG